MRQQLGKLHASGQGTKIEVERARPVGELNQDFVEVVSHQRKKEKIPFLVQRLANC